MTGKSKPGKKALTIFHSKNPEMTLAFAERFSKKLRSGDVLLLSGPYGAGKTVFTKGLAKGLGIKECVFSPSYVYLSVYQSKKAKLFHFDVYRAKSGFVPESVGLTPEIRAEGIIAVEWGERVKKFFDRYYEIGISYGKGKERIIKITRYFPPLERGDTRGFDAKRGF